MKQMPVEGRKFNKVDRIWRNIMAKTVSDTRVLQATSQPNMLVSDGKEGSSWDCPVLPPLPPFYTVFIETPTLAELME